MIPGETINLRAVERHDVPLIHRWFNDPVVMDGWGWSAPARSMQHVAGQVEDWLARETAFDRPEALIAESLAGDPIGLVVVRVDRPEARSVELSLLVDADHWGQGFGMDMMQTILEACFDWLGSAPDRRPRRRGQRARPGSLPPPRLQGGGPLAPGRVSGWPACGRAPLWATCRRNGPPMRIEHVHPRITEQGR